MTDYIPVHTYVRKDGRELAGRTELRVDMDDVAPGLVGLQSHGSITGNEITGQSLLDLSGATALRDALTTAIEKLKEQDSAQSRP